MSSDTHEPRLALANGAAALGARVSLHATVLIAGAGILALALHASGMRRRLD